QLALCRVKSEHYDLVEKMQWQENPHPRGRHAFHKSADSVSLCMVGDKCRSLASNAGAHMPDHSISHVKRPMSEQSQTKTEVNNLVVAKISLLEPPRRIECISTVESCGRGRRKNFQIRGGYVQRAIVHSPPG